MHPEAMGQWILDTIDDGLHQLDLADKGLSIVVRRWADDLSTFGVDWPDWAKDSAYHAAMAALTAQFGIIREILNAMRDRVARMGLPTVLRAEADALETGIAKATQAVSDQCTSQNLRGLTNEGWISDGAEHYLAAYEKHEDQLDEVKTSVAGMIRVLRDSAASQDAWYSSNLFNAIGGVVTLAGVVITIVGGFGTPVAWVGLAIGVVGLLISVIGYFIARGDSESRASVLSEVLTSSALPAWPKPVFAA